MTTIKTTDAVDPSVFGVYVMNSDTDIISSSGSHLFYIYGSFDTLTAAGGPQLVLANGGHNTISLTSSNNTICVSGGNNSVDAGGGINSITDAAGQGDTIVMPSAAGGFDNISLLAGAEAKLDFTTALKGTNWDGLASDLGSYISATATAAGTTVSLSATANGAAVAVARINVPGGAAWDPSTILSHVVS
jgi:hypothetical protein